VHVNQLPFEPLTLAFRGIGYTVTVSSGESIALLSNVNGYFEPGTITALMGSNGAGKTTLLDVLAGRKNTGVVSGDVFINGAPKIDAYFRKVTAYMEQVDTLQRKCTAKEVIAFSAALRLTSDISSTARDQWVKSVVQMMDLEPIQDNLVGVLDQGGMSFEQRKRVPLEWNSPPIRSYFSWTSPPQDWTRELPKYCCAIFAALQPLAEVSCALFTNRLRHSSSPSTPYCFYKREAEPSSLESLGSKRSISSNTSRASLE